MITKSQHKSNKFSYPSTLVQTQLYAQVTSYIRMNEDIFNGAGINILYKMTKWLILNI